MTDVKKKILYSFIVGIIFTVASVVDYVLLGKPDSFQEVFQYFYHEPGRYCFYLFISLVAVVGWTVYFVNAFFLLKALLDGYTNPYWDSGNMVPKDYILVAIGYLIGVCSVTFIILKILILAIFVPIVIIFCCQRVYPLKKDESSRALVF